MGHKESFDTFFFVIKYNRNRKEIVRQTCAKGGYNHHTFDSFLQECGVDNLCIKNGIGEGIRLGEGNGRNYRQW